VRSGQERKRRKKKKNDSRSLFLVVVVVRRESGSKVKSKPRKNFSSSSTSFLFLALFFLIPRSYFAIITMSNLQGNAATGKYTAELIENAAKLVREGRGILAADESTGTIGKRVSFEFV